MGLAEPVRFGFVIPADSIVIDVTALFGRRLARVPRDWRCFNFRFRARPSPLATTRRTLPVPDGTRDAGRGACDVVTEMAGGT
jgi:hypothetical protein